MNNWEFIEAEKLYKKVTDGTHDSPKYTSEGYPLVTSKNIKDGVLDLSTANLISNIDYDEINKRSKVEQWDLIISMIGEYCGYTYIEKNTLIKYAVKNVGLFKTCSELEANWLSYYLKSDFGKHFLKQSRSGSSQPYISLGALRGLKILNPSIEIKEGIVNAIKPLDDKIELNNRINAELEAMAKTLYDYWFVQFDFPNKDGKPYKTSGGKMAWNEELKREIPEGWEVKYLTEEMDLQYGFPFSTELFNDDGIGVPVIRIRDILNCSISIYSTEKVDVKYRINKGDIIVGMDGNFHINYWNKDNCYLNQRSLRIRSNNESINEIQARYSIEPFIEAREKNVSRTTVAHLSAKDVNDLKILKADSELQKKANVFFKSNLEKIVSNRIQNQKLTELRDWLLPMLMNGQVKVN